MRRPKQLWYPISRQKLNNFFLMWKITDKNLNVFFDFNCKVEIHWLPESIFTLPRFLFKNSSNRLLMWWLKFILQRFCKVLVSTIQWTTASNLRKISNFPGKRKKPMWICLSIWIFFANTFKTTSIARESFFCFQSLNFILKLYFFDIFFWLRLRI